MSEALLGALVGGGISVVTVLIAQFFANWRENTRRIEQRLLAEHQEEAERRLAENQAQEKAFQTYLDRMADLIRGGLTNPDSATSDLVAVARSRTYSTLRSLNGVRKGEVLRFLHDAGLIKLSEPIVSLSRADFSGVQITNAELNGSNLAEANLVGAELTNTWLIGADLSGADLSFSELKHVDFNDANLSQAILEEANLQETLLGGATLIETDLFRVKGLTSDQLRWVKTLLGAMLDPELSKQVNEQFPEVLEPPKKP